MIVTPVDTEHGYVCSTHKIEPRYFTPEEWMAIHGEETISEQLRSNRYECLCKAWYTLKHKVAYLYIEYKLTGSISMKGLRHDSDKLAAYLVMGHLGVEEINNIHRRTQDHHPRNELITDWYAAVIDWECARYTKPDKQLTARETMNYFYPDFRDEVEPVLKEFGL